MNFQLTKMNWIAEVNSEKLTFATFMERLAFMVNPNLDYKFAPSKG